MRMLNRKLSRALVLAGSGASLSAMPAPTYAAGYANGNQTAQFNATLQVVDNCAIAAFPLDFGPAQGAAVDTTINITCSHATLYNVGFSAAAGATASAMTQYRSASGVNVGTVRFKLAQGARAMSRNNTLGSVTLSGASSGLAHLLSMYRQISTHVTPTYKPTLTATVYF